MPFVMELRPGEALLINGAELECATKARLLLHNKARFLFGTQVMRAQQATTPLRLLYRALQTAYVGPEEGRETARRVAQAHLSEAGAELSTGDLVSLAEALITFDAGRHHEAMRAVQHLMHESEARTKEAAA